MLNKKILGVAMAVLLAAAVWMGGCVSSPKPCDCDTSVKKDDNKCDYRSDEACRKIIEERSKKGLFRHRWWNYYERALSWAECGKWECAVADLKEAIKQRSKDQWDARTYGMRFIDYFPNRELGIAYYYLGKFPDAKNCLECSLEWTPSDKALVYLEKTYQVLIADAEKPDELSYPQVSCNIIQDKTQDNTLKTKDDPINLRITVNDEKYIKSIRVNDNPIFLLISSKDVKRHTENNGKKQLIFDTQLFLREDPHHKVKIEATNIMGLKNKDNDEVIICVDRSGPMIMLDNKVWADGSTSDDKRMIISGSLTDNSGISELFINENKIPVIQETEIYFNETVSVKSDEAIKIVAYDQLGNQTDTILPLHSVLSNNSKLLACADTSLSQRVFAAQDADDNRPPNIRVKNLKDGQEVSRKWFVIKADAEDESNIKSLRVNNKEIPHKQGSLISFNYEIDLQQDNIIEATDEKGNIETVLLRQGNGEKEASLSYQNNTPLIPLQSRDIEKYMASVSFDGTPNKIVNSLGRTYTENNLIFAWNLKDFFTSQTTITYRCCYYNEDRLTIFVFPFNFVGTDRIGRYSSSEFREALRTAIREQNRTTTEENDKKTFNTVNCLRGDCNSNNNTLSSFSHDVNSSILDNPLPKDRIEEASEILRNTRREVRCFIRGDMEDKNYVYLPIDLVTNLENMMPKEYETRAQLENFLKKDVIGNRVSYNVYIKDIIDNAEQCGWYISYNDLTELTNIKERPGSPIIYKTLIEIIDENITSFNAEKMVGATCNPIEDFVQQLSNKLREELKRKLRRELKEEEQNNITTFCSEEVCKVVSFSRYKLSREIIRQKLSKTILGSQLKITIHDTAREMNLEKSIPVLNVYYSSKEEDSQGWAESLAAQVGVEFPFFQGEVTSIENGIIKTTFPEKTNIKKGSRLLARNQTNTPASVAVVVDPESVGAECERGSSIGEKWKIETE